MSVKKVLLAVLLLALTALLWSPSQVQATTRVREVANDPPVPGHHPAYVPLHAPKRPAITGGMMHPGRMLMIQLMCRHSGKVLIRNHGRLISQHRFTCRHWNASPMLKMPVATLRQARSAHGVRLLVVIKSGRAVRRTMITLHKFGNTSAQANRSSQSRTTARSAGVSALTPKQMSAPGATGVFDEYWKDTATHCLGSGTGSGGAITIGPRAYALLAAADFGAEQVYWKAWIYYVNATTGQGDFQQISADWEPPYVPYPNGASQSGSFDPNTLVVTVGGVSAPGQSPPTANANINPGGFYVWPLIEAWSASGGDQWASVPVYAGDVTAPASYTDPNWCVFPA